MSSEEMKVVDEYLAVLRNASAAAPAAERAEFMREIHSHILDRIEAENCVTEGQVREILRRIGDPHRLATQLGTESMLRRAVKSISPLFLLRTTLRWAMTGLAGSVVFVVTLIGYGSAAVAYLVVILKPFFPSNIGLWLGPEGRLTLGFWDGHLIRSEVYGLSMGLPDGIVIGTLTATDGPVRELAGHNIYAGALVFGAICVLVATLFARWAIRRFALKRNRPALPATHCRPATVASVPHSAEIL